MKTKTVVKKLTLKKLVHEKGMRISADALDKLITILDETTEQLIDDVVAVAKHAKRKTVKVKDIELVTK